MMQPESKPPYAPGCGCPYDEHDAWCPTLNQPPTERAGLSVGDDVLLIPHHGRAWPARILGFTSLDCDIEIEWTGLRPFTGSDRNTICRRELAAIQPAQSAPTPESAS